MDTVYGKECEKMPHDKALHMQCIVSEMYQFYAHVRALVKSSDVQTECCECLKKMPNIKQMTCSHILEWARGMIAHRWTPRDTCPVCIEDQLNTLSIHSPSRGKCHASLNTLECLL